MDRHPDITPDEVATDHSGVGLSLACPDCKTVSWVKWERLGGGMRCPSCTGRFWIGRTGKLKSWRKVAQLRFTCPRCGQVGALPAHARSVNCVSCELPLLLGPDHRLHTAAELKQVKRQFALAAQSQESAAGKTSRKRGLALAVGTVGCVLVLGAALLAAAFMPERPASIAEKFTRLCLAGDWRAAAAEVIADDRQQAEFQQWRIIHFSSIRDSFRPAGDTLDIDIVLLQADSERQSFKVTMRSSFIGARAHTQCWRLHDGHWLLDVVVSAGQD